MMDFIRKLEIGDRNPAASCDGDWLTAKSSFASINPATGKPIAEAGGAGAAELEQVLATTHEAFLRWREVPAPKRGECVRRIG